MGSIFIYPGSMGFKVYLLLIIYIGWLRTEEENIRMREAKLVNSSGTSKAPEAIAQPSQQSTENKTASDPTPHPVSTINGYQPSFEDILLYLSGEDVKFIENIVDSYWKAYRY